MNRGVFSDEFSDVFEDVLSDLFGEFPSQSGRPPGPQVDREAPDIPEPPVSLPIELLADEFDLGLPVQAAGATSSKLNAGIDPASDAENSVASTVLTGVDPMAKKPSGTPGGGPPGGGGGDDGGDGGGGGDPVLAATYTSGSADDLVTDYFNIDIHFFGAWDGGLMDAFAQAADFLSSVMLSGLVNDSQAWYTFQDPFGSDGYFTVDDVLIEAYLPEIDGPGNVLGQAGPYSMRSPGTTDEYTTVVGLMEFDVADANVLYTANDWDAVVLHEMIHVLGLGTLWDQWGVTDTVVDDNGTRRPNDDIVTSVYTGANGLDFYAAEKDTDMPDALLIEMDGGAGTAGGHWDDDTYTTELMTGYLYPDDPYLYLADWTLASLADGGYDVDLASMQGTANNNALSDGIDLETWLLANSFDLTDDAGTLIT